MSLNLNKETEEMESSMSKETAACFTLQYLTRKTVSLSYSII